MEDGRSLTEILLIAAFDPILIQEWVIHQSFFFVPNTLLLLRDGKPLFREGVISKIAISLRCCQLGMKHLGVE